MKQMLFFILALAVGILNVSADVRPDVYMPEVVPTVIFWDYPADAHKYYVFADEEKTEVKAVESRKHSTFWEYIPDYQANRRSESAQSYCNIPDYVTDANGVRLKVVGIESGLFNDGKIGCVSLPSTVDMIEPNTFCRSEIGEIKFSNGLRVIMHDSFNSLEIDQIALPKSLYQIQSDCFNDCKITKIELPDYLFLIGNNCFNGIADVEQVILPKRLEQLGESCFNDCRSLKKVRISKYIDKIEDCFNGCRDIVEIEFENKHGYDLNISESFKDVDKSVCRIIVPDNSRLSYACNPQWEGFTILEKSQVSSISDIANEEPADVATQKYYSLDGIEINRESLRPGTPYVDTTSGNTPRKIIIAE